MMIAMWRDRIQTGSVTAADLFGEVTAARREIGQVLSKVEVVSATQLTLAAQMNDHEIRIRSLDDQVPDSLTTRLVSVERWQWKASAIISAIALAAGLASGYLGFLLGHVH